MKELMKKFANSIWLFPALLTILLAILSVLQLHGSSLGVYHSFFYGDTRDSNLIAGTPRHIRSDEWLVNTQKSLSQKNNNYKIVNANIGYGEDLSLLSDAPYRDWSTIFKPYNLGFLVLPFDNAFALKWWLMSYFLVLSTYFFVLTILPGKKLLAVLLSLGFLFSPFFQWWYLYGTLGTVTYTLLGVVVFIRLIHSRKLKHAIWWGVLLAYIGIAFALILYPPFQIPCLIVALAFIIGYILDSKKSFTKKQLRNNFLIVVSAIIVAATIFGLFLYQKRNIVETISNTAYPGQRIVESGGYDKWHFLSSQLNLLLQSNDRSSLYSVPSSGANNQSSSSNFLLLIPFILIPALIVARWKRKTISYTVLSLSITTIIYLSWLFIPNLDLIGKITLLDKVPQARLLIGFGLLNLLILVMFIKCYGAIKQRLSISLSAIYSLLVFIFVLLINFHVVITFPGFVGYRLAIILAVPFAIIIFCILRKYFTLAAASILAFSFISTFIVNPLYRGTDTLTKTPLSQAIQEVSSHSSKKWAIGNQLQIENFVAMNGKPSLSGTYLYPQLSLWDKLNQTEKQSLYNRYAHVLFTFDDNPYKRTETQLISPQADRFDIILEPCNNFFKETGVGYLLTLTKFDEYGDNSCLKLKETVRYPNYIYYIYSVSL